ncbi:MAG TPA: hypothetical protein VIW67_14955 [Terriglobales bacterium]|jgi:hypothetical protein
MKDAAGERWKQLCAQAAVEQDPERLVELANEISRLLEEKDRRLKGFKPEADCNSVSQKSGLPTSKTS